MATAVINKAPPVTQPPDTVTLTLSLEEAEVIKFLTGHVLGSFNGPRRFTSSIYESLKDVNLGRKYDQFISKPPFSFF